MSTIPNAMRAALVQGLYAAGRNAVGLCGNGYFASGTSIADCIFAGRRAGRDAASRQVN